MRRRDRAPAIARMQDHAFAHAEQIDAFFTIVFALVDPLDPNEIAERLDGVVEADTMRTPIGGGLVIIPFERIVIPSVLVISSLAKYSRKKTAPVA